MFINIEDEHHSVCKFVVPYQKCKQTRSLKTPEKHYVQK